MVFPLLPREDTGDHRGRQGAVRLALQDILGLRGCLHDPCRSVGRARRTGREFFRPHGGNRPVLEGTAGRMGNMGGPGFSRISCRRGTLPNNSPRKLYLNFRNNLLMMYKNLPARSRSRIVFVRMCVDGAIACVYLITGKISFFKSVLRAHRDFRRMRREVTVSPAGIPVPRSKVSIIQLALRGFRYPSGKVGD